MKEKIIEKCITSIKNNWEKFLELLITLVIAFCAVLIVSELKEWKDILWIFCGSFLWLVLLFLVVAIVIPIMSVIKDYFAAKNAFEYNWMDKNIDFTPEKDVEYYRELTEVESPFLINEIYGGIVTKNVVVAELLSLEKRGIIRLTDDKISVVKNENLLQCEKPFLRCVREGKVNITDVKNFMWTLNRLAKQELLSNQKYYHYRKQNKKEKISEYIIASVMSILILVFANLILCRSSYIEPFSSEWMLGMGFALVIVICVFIEASTSKIKLAETHAFKELEKKIKGLEKFLKEYSMLEERTAKEIELWEDYLIYSVLFGHNKQVVEEYEKYIDVDYNS